MTDILIVQAVKRYIVLYTDYPDKANFSHHIKKTIQDFLKKSKARRVVVNSIKKFLINYTIL